MSEAGKFAFQGAPGAFSHQAANVFSQAAAGQEAGVIACKSFAEVFDAVNDGKANFGVIPLENSSVGSITINYDLLWANDVSIAGEVFLPIRHQLIGLPQAQISEIHSVYSHPVALDQCRKFFSKMKHMRPIAHFDTSGAVLLVKESNDPSMAAIAGEFAAQQYGLTILEKNIEDHAGNSTRFGIISRGGVSGLSFPAKLSCAVELSHRPGALAALLTAIADLDINLSKVESRPIPEQPWHYRFFVDLELSDKSQYQQASLLLAANSEVYKPLGLYTPWASLKANADK